MSTSVKPLPAPGSDPVERALRAFRRNLDALRVFAGEIGYLADQPDREVMDGGVVEIEADDD